MVDTPDSFIHKPASMTQPAAPLSTPVLAFALLIIGTTLGIAGTDLVLPAVPGLPDTLGGSQAMAQLVLAAFVAGGCVGLVLYGELGAHFDQRNLLVLSFIAYAIISLACVLAPSLPVLVGLRFAQGLTGSAAAVFAPGMIRALFSEARAVHALGVMASVESLVPALAPVIGVWLLVAFGWKSSFILIGGLSCVVAALVAMLRHRLPPPDPTRGAGSYLRLATSPVFLRYALSQAFTLGGLLIFVFGAPAMITKGLDGTLNDFIIMQVTGITVFIIGSNVAGRLADRFGAEPMIVFGTWLSAAGLVALAAYGLVGGTHPLALAILFVPVNLGLGLRGPPGFFRAILAANGDDARGAALVLVAILSTTAAGTAVAAPFVTLGIAPLAAIAAAVSCGSALCLLALPKLPG
ncbi:Permease,MFS [Hyphomonas johnsonii MHS-2]|uniref:Permease,MFS n=2 Tax=Hyphomonas johnsonii TaxID=81031 RepID=A0A059FFV5_9PROT|nr:Permease,MFS [Hyphomonas johnsonii MHS-2]